MRKMDHCGNDPACWQALLRVYLVGKDMRMVDVAARLGVSRATMQRLLALPGQGRYSRKRWRAPAINNMLRRLDVPKPLAAQINVLAAREEGYEI